MLIRDFQICGIYKERYTQQTQNHIITHVHEVFVFTGLQPHPTQNNMIGCCFFQLYPVQRNHCIFVLNEPNAGIPTFSPEYNIQNVLIRTVNHNLELRCVDGIGTPYFDGTSINSDLKDVINSLFSDADYIETIIQSDTMQYERVQKITNKKGNQTPEECG